MVVIPGEAKLASAVGARALALVVHDEVALQQYHGGIRHWPPIRVDDLALNYTAVIERDITVPRERGACDHKRCDHPATLCPARHHHPLVAPEVSPRMNSFCAMRNTKIEGANTMAAKA